MARAKIPEKPQKQSKEIRIINKTAGDRINTTKIEMKNLFFLLCTLFGIGLSANAQLAYITSVNVITSNGTFERSKINVNYQLTSEGMKEVYENNRNLEIIITADVTVSPLLQSATRSDVFYPIDNGDGRRKNADIIEFQCVNHDAAVSLSERGVSTSEFSIRTRLH